MKKLFALFAVLVLAVFFAKVDKADPLKDTDIVINQSFFPDISVRREIVSCLSGERGRFSSPFEVTLYTFPQLVEKYREIKGCIESWGGVCRLYLKEETDIFDFRSLNGLPLYIWQWEGDIFDAYLSENSELYSTGLKSAAYDGLEEGRRQEYLENLSIILRL